MQEDVHFNMVAHLYTLTQLHLHKSRFAGSALLKRAL